MKKCRKCNIEVGGDLRECPLCKSKLSGDDEPYWPEPSELKKASAFYKKQLIIVVLACVVVFILGLTVFKNSHTHHWVLIILWSAAAEVIIRSVLKKYRPLPEVLTEIAFAVCALCGFSAVWFSPLLYPVPIIITGIIAVDFCFALVDKNGYYLVTFLCSILISVVTYVLVFIFMRGISVWWHISFAACVAALFIMFIVKGKYVFSEIKRRLWM